MGWEEAAALLARRSSFLAVAEGFAVVDQSRAFTSEPALRLTAFAVRGRMLMTALKCEADSYVERHRSARDEQGRALVVRNGRAATRKVTLGAGTVELQAPRVRAPAHAISSSTKSSSPASPAS
jgi:hypothetical protein